MSLVDVKVVLLGREFSGKTSLVERFMNDRFAGHNRYQNTIGAAYGAKKMLVDGDRELILGLWDTAGSERYESMSRIYYRSAKAAVVCYDVTNSESWDRIHFWIAELQKFEPACRIYLCGNKTDLLRGDRRNRAVDYHNTTDFAEEIGATLVETSSKTGENVAELFQAIAEDYARDPKNFNYEPVGAHAADSKSVTISVGKQSKSKSCCVRK